MFSLPEGRVTLAEVRHVMMCAHTPPSVSEKRNQENSEGRGAPRDSPDDAPLLTCHGRHGRVASAGDQAKRPPERQTREAAAVQGSRRRLTLEFMRAGHLPGLMFDHSFPLQGGKTKRTVLTHWATPSMAWASDTRFWTKWELNQLRVAQTRITRRVAGRFPTGQENWPLSPKSHGDLGQRIVESNRRPCLGQGSNGHMVALGGTRRALGSEGAQHMVLARGVVAQRLVCTRRCLRWPAGFGCSAGFVSRASEDGTHGRSGRVRLERDHSGPRCVGGTQAIVCPTHFEKDEPRRFVATPTPPPVHTTHTHGESSDKVCMFPSICTGRNSGIHLACKVNGEPRCDRRGEKCMSRVDGG